MDLIRDKQHSWKKKIYWGLHAVHQKLQHYYQQTYGSHGVIYAIATILDPSQKLSPFQSASWTGDGEQWDQHYLDVMKQIFAYYQDHSPAVKEDVYYPSQLSGFNKAHNHSKHQ